jgi:hypothetical protein
MILSLSFSFQISRNLSGRREQKMRGTIVVLCDLEWLQFENCQFPELPKNKTTE